MTLGYCFVPQCEEAVSTEKPRGNGLFIHPSMEQALTGPLCGSLAWRLGTLLAGASPWFPEIVF